MKIIPIKTLITFAIILYTSFLYGANDHSRLMQKYLCIKSNNWKGFAYKDFAGSEKIIQDTLNSIFLNNFLEVELTTNEIPSDSLRLVIRFECENGNFGRKEFKIGDCDYHNVFCLDSLNPSSPIKIYSLSLALASDPNQTIKTNYSIQQKDAFVSVKALIYLLVILAYFLFAFNFIKWKNYSKWALKKFNKNWIAIISICSQVLLIILVFDEIGLLLQEWNIHSSFFSVFRYILELPGLTHLVLLANFGLVLPAVYSLSVGMIDQLKLSNSNNISEWLEYPNYRELISVFFSFALFNISLIVFLGQCFVYDEFHMAGGNGFIIIIYGLLILIGPIIIMFKQTVLERRTSREFNPYRYDSWFDKEIIFITLLIIFLTLSQTMITKVLLLLAIANWSKPIIFKLISKFKKSTISAYEKIPNKEYENLTIGLTSSSLLVKWSFVFLCSSFIPLILLFQIHSSPYPPSDSAFPKTETISALYMVYMILFLFVDNKGKFVWLKSTLWILITVFILYVTPIVFTDWYLPSLDPPGFSFLDAMNIFSGLNSTMAFICLVHIICTIVFFNSYRIAELKTGNCYSKDSIVSVFKKNFYIILFNNNVLNILPIIMLFILANSLVYKYGNLLISFNIEILLSIVCALLPVFSLASNNRKISDLKEEFASKSDNESIFHLEKQFPLITSFKSWNKKKNTFKGNFFIATPIILTFLLTYGALTLPENLRKSNTSLKWSIRDDNVKDMGCGIIKHKYSITAVYADSICSYSLDSGKKRWSIPIHPVNISLISEDKLLVVSYFSVDLLNTDNGKNIWTTYIPNVKYGLKNYPYIIVNQENFLIKTKKEMLVFDLSTGFLIGKEQRFKTISKIVDAKSSIGWINQADSLVLWSHQSGKTNLMQIKDSVIDLYSLSKAFITISKTKLNYITGSGNLRWSYDIEPENRIWDILVKDSVIVVDSKNGITAISTESGKQIWNQKDLNTKVKNVSNIEHANVNERYIIEIDNRNYLFASYKENIYLIDIVTGSKFIEFKKGNKENLFFNNLSIGVSGNVLCSLSPFRIQTFSIVTGEKLYWDLYFKHIKKELGDININNLFGSMIIEDGEIYLSNGYGIFAISFKQ